MTDKRGPGRPRKATPRRTKEGYSSRVWVEREGEKVRATVKLGTKSKTVATARKNRVLAGQAPELFVEKSESFRVMTERVLEASGRKGKDKVLAQLRTYAYPVMGSVAVADVTVEHVLDALAAVEASVGGWTGSVRNMKSAISLVLGTLVRRRVLKENVALGIDFDGKDEERGGRRIRRVRPPRLVLTDEEFERLLAHLVGEVESGGQWAKSALETLMLCLGARIFGMRTSDLHAWIWEMIDRDTFLDAYVPRPKTDGDLLDDPADDEGAVLEAWQLEPRSALPEAFGGWLRLWWERAGRPGEGHVFGVRQGKRAGLARKRGVSYVERLRAALWRAGVTRPLPGFDRAQGDAARRALCALQSGMGRRRSKVDFHSFRRASATAVGRAVVTGELSLREAMLLTHHQDPAVFARYQARGERLVVPASALPQIAPPRIIMAATLPLNPPVKLSTQPKTAASVPHDEAKGDCMRKSEATHDVVSPAFSHTGDEPYDTVTPRPTTERQNSLPVLSTLTEVLELAVRLAMSEGDFDAASALLEVAKRRRATLPDNVSTLDSSRRRKS